MPANDPTYIVCHHTADPSAGNQFDKVNASHKNRGFPLSKLGYHVGYHLLIERSGEKRRARHDDEFGAHTTSYWPPYIGINRKSIGICLAGDFTKEPPTVAQLKSLKELLEYFQAEHGIPDEKVLLHKQAKSTACPGVDLVYLAKTLFVPDYAEMLRKAEEALPRTSGKRKMRLTRLIKRLRRELAKRGEG